MAPIEPWLPALPWLSKLLSRITSFLMALSGCVIVLNVMLPELEPAGFHTPGSVPLDVMISRYLALPGAACALASFGSSNDMKGENIASISALRVNSRRFQLRIMVSESISLSVYAHSVRVSNPSREGGGVQYGHQRALQCVAGVARLLANEVVGAHLLVARPLRFVGNAVAVVREVVDHAGAHVFDLRQVVRQPVHARQREGDLRRDQGTAIHQRHATARVHGLARFHFAPQTEAVVVLKREADRIHQLVAGVTGFIGVVRSITLAAGSALDLGLQVRVQIRGHL